MKYKPLISIITPTYNHEKYISECIESVLAQSYDKWEMIIIDDCSNDFTPDIVTEYMKKDERIKFLRHKENYGPFYLDRTYNEALEIARGEWIAVLEGDDVWVPYKLERQVQILNEIMDDSDVVLLHGNSGYIWEDINLVSLNRTPYLFVMPGKYNAFEYFSKGIIPTFALTVIIRKKSLLEIGGFRQFPREIRCVDFPTFLCLSYLGKFYYDDIIYGFWRRHGKSITMNYTTEQIISSLKALEIFSIENNLKLNVSSIDTRGSYFALIISLINNAEWEKAHYYYKEYEEFLKKRKGKLYLNLINKIKLQILNLSIKLRSRKLLTFVFNIKRRYLDKVICNYEPMFFKKHEILQKLLIQYNKLNCLK